MTEETIDRVVDRFMEVIREERTNFWIGPEPHYNDHKFVQAIRKIIYVVGTTAIVVTVPAVIYILATHWPTP